MRTRCKFVCEGRAECKETTGSTYSFTFRVPYDDTPENKQFFKYTPAGQLTLSVVREDQFVPGQSYYVDFTSVEA